MNAASHTLLLALALAGAAAADLPKKAPLTKYTRLWTDSPFTSKPEPPPIGPVANPLEDYALLGVSPVAAGYRVTMINKKQPEERVIIETNRPAEGFKILSVAHKPGDPLGTVVRLESGSTTGTIAFEDKFLTLAPPPAPKAAPQQPPGIPGQPPQPGQPNQPQVRQPRPRVVPPPAPAANQQQQQQQQQPQQPQQQGGSERPDRRGRR
jgi:hypothetical protein